MALKYAPEVGRILICDFSGTIHPEICKRRPVVFPASNSPRLCTVVPLSTTAPDPVEERHYLIRMKNPLPRPYDEEYHWAKCDMIFVASFDRLFVPFDGKDAGGKRRHIRRVVSSEELDAIKRCIAKALSINLDKDGT